MNKRDLIKFLEPFADEIEIEIEPKYVAASDEGYIKNLFQSSHPIENERVKGYFCEDKDSSCRFYTLENHKCYYIHYCIYKQKCD